MKVYGTERVLLNLLMLIADYDNRKQIDNIFVHRDYFSDSCLQRFLVVMFKFKLHLKSVSLFLKWRPDAGSDSLSLF